MSGLSGVLSSARAQAVVVLVLAFLAGAFAGGAFERSDLRRGRPMSVRGGGRGEGRFGGRGGPGMDGRSGGNRGRSGPNGARGGGPPPFLDALGVSAAQRAAIDSIVRRRSVKTDSLMKLSRALYDSTRREIDAVLTKAQRDSLEAMRSRGRGGFRARP